MKNKLILGLIIILSTPTLAFAWGAATHTYLAKQLGNKYGIMNKQEMYGSVLPDMFNLMFGYQHQEYLWTETHYEFMKLVDIAKFGRRKALAYGFTSHNDAWGADYTAHISAASNLGEGYVVTKRNILAPQLVPEIEAFLFANGIPYTPELLEELSLSFADNAVESAVDLLVSQNQDRRVGYRMLISAKYRSPFVPFLLARAYGRDFARQAGIRPWQASVIIMQTEKQFKEYMEIYGGILTQENAVDLMAEYGAQLAEVKLENKYGISVDVPPDLMKQCLLAAIGVVAGDYSLELGATLDYVEEQLEAHGVETYSW